MRKIFPLAQILVLLWVSSNSVVPVRASPAVLNVGPGQPYALISAALPFAMPGDAIHVWNNPGIPYIENPTIGVANIHIIGQSVAGVTVQAAGPGPCFSILAPGVTIMNLQILGSAVVPGTFGVYLFSSSMQCNILNNQILNFDYGVYINNSMNNQIIGNDISNCIATMDPPPICSTAVYMVGVGATGNIVKGNDLGLTAPNWFGVGTNGASGNTITYNNFWGGPFNVPQAFIVLGDFNAWDDGGSPLFKGNFWNDPWPRPPYLIAGPNMDAFCSPGNAPYNWALYPMLADVNRDLKIEIRDVATAAKAFGTAWSTPKWNPIADLAPDSKIDIKDVASIAKYFGWSDP